jgi:hypothetical protein
MRILITALLIGGITVTAAAQPKRPVTIAHEFHVSEPGGKTTKTLKQMSEPELRAIVTAGCAALAHGCPRDLSHIIPAARVPGMVIAEGENVYITGQVLKQQDDKWWGIYAAPKGYTACRAALSKVIVTAGSMFDTTIASRASPRGLLFHARISNGRAEKPGSVHAYLVVQYVPIGAETRLKCMSDGSPALRIATR